MIIQEKESSISHYWEGKYNKVGQNHRSVNQSN